MSSHPDSHAARFPSEMRGDQVRHRDREAHCSVLNDRRKPIGYLDVKAIKSKFEKGEAGLEDQLGELLSVGGGWIC